MEWCNVAVIGSRYVDQSCDFVQWFGHGVLSAVTVVCYSYDTSSMIHAPNYKSPKHTLFLFAPLKSSPFYLEKLEVNRIFLRRNTIPLKVLPFETGHNIVTFHDFYSDLTNQSYNRWEEDDVYSRGHL